MGEKLTGTPVITVGSVGLDTVFDVATVTRSRAAAEGIEHLVERLERAEFDLVAGGRALLAGPEWANKILGGRENELIPFARDAWQTLH